MADIRKLNSVHYKTLRIIENDWKKKKKRAKLDKLGWAKPSLWAKYTPGISLVLKTLKREYPVYIYNKQAEGTRRCPGEIWSTKNVFDLA